jgi:hypothetical protein
LANDSERAKSLGEQALKAAETTFSPEHIQQSFDDGLQEAVRLGPVIQTV